MIFALLIVLAFVCAAARYLVIRYTRHIGVANGVAATIVVAFFLGSLSQPFGAAPPTAAPLASAPPAPAASDVAAASAPAGVPVSNAADASLTDVSGRCRNMAPPTQSNGAGSIDAIATDSAAKSGLTSGSQIDGNRPSVLVGWAASDNRKSPALAACLLVDDAAKAGVVERYGVPRPDVATALQAPMLGKAGFKIMIPAGTLAPGSHKLSVAVISADRSVAELSPSFTVVAQ